MSDSKTNPGATKLPQHKRQGSKLVPPLAATPKLQNASWRDERLPEMLWAALLTSQLERGEALEIFRGVAKFISDPHRRSKQIHDITHTGLSRMGGEELDGVIERIVRGERCRKALEPMMLFRELPARAAWSKRVGNECDLGRADDLMAAVGKTLWHQSQEATDCRWVRVLCDLASGSFQTPEEFSNKILNYPNEGDMREVRPLIRSTEIGMWFPMMERFRQWPNDFGAECLAATPCMSWPNQEDPLNPTFGTTYEIVNRVRRLLLGHWSISLSTTAVDAEHDALFGGALYCLNLVEDLIDPNVSHSATGRIALRTILECCITMRYLVANRNPELWATYRAYGAGQAKLAYLKLEGLDHPPNSISVDTLRELANEDLWEEFVSIELGNWGKRNLRDISIDAGTKDDYDKFHSWTSTFAHSQWCAVRDSVFDTCANPLHRLHRIPRSTRRNLGDTQADACLITDRFLDLLSARYPVFSSRITVIYARPS